MIGELMVVAAQSTRFPWAFVLVYVVGFVGVVSIGLVAFYNSKRPPGMEGAKRPSFIPKIDTEDEIDTGDGSDLTSEGGNGERGTGNSDR